MSSLLCWSSVAFLVYPSIWYFDKALCRRSRLQSDDICKFDVCYMPWTVGSQHLICQEMTSIRFSHCINIPQPCIGMKTYFGPNQQAINLTGVSGGVMIEEEVTFNQNFIVWCLSDSAPQRKCIWARQFEFVQRQVDCMVKHWFRTPINNHLLLNSSWLGSLPPKIEWLLLSSYWGRRIVIRMRLAWTLCVAIVSIYSG